jgi:hypothetical protein
VDSSDSEWMAEGHLPLQETPSSVWPEGRLDMEEPLSGWPWVPLDMDDTHKDQEPSPNKKWDIILKEGLDLIGVGRAAVRLEVCRHTRRTGTRDIQGHRELGWAHAFCQACIAFQLGHMKPSEAQQIRWRLLKARWHAKICKGSSACTSHVEATASDGPAYVTHVKQQTHEVNASMQEWPAHARHGACLFLSCSSTRLVATPLLLYFQAVRVTHVRARELS